MFHFIGATSEEFFHAQNIFPVRVFVGNFVDIFFDKENPQAAHVAFVNVKSRIGVVFFEGIVRLAAVNESHQNRGGCIFKFYAKSRGTDFRVIGVA